MQPLYTSRLIKASARIADTKVLLAAWDLSQSVQTNLDIARRNNIMGYASRSRVEDVLVILRQRYFDNLEIGTALVTLVQGGAPAQWVDPLLYYYSVQNDETLRAIVLEVIATRQMSGRSDLTPEQVMSAIRGWVAEGKTTTSWNDETIGRVARNAIAALRDYGLLEGKQTKSISSIYLPVESFAFLAFDLWIRLRSGEKVLHSPEWKLFLLPLQAVERFFLEAHQERLLSYDVAGSVVRLEFAANSLVEVAHALVKRARGEA